MSLKLQSGLSPNSTKLIICLAALIGVLTLWNGLKSRINSWTYQPVYGQQNHEAVTPVREDLVALPIVIAKSDAATPPAAEGITDADIDAAFKAPEPEPEKAKEAAPVISIGQQFQALYRPVVSAVGGGGAIINGNFWSVGEAITSMPVRTRDGAVVSPVVSAASKSGVTVRLGSESITLPFAGY
ncbi:hypothetical protein [Pseudomonas sp.]|uniref:hypothetical protein n=1 Tax=Pseudomonas sp. TaxID=306 RepID=UPI0029116E8A|nr:hypothetical protein [Pseudomonas sp.]MDU4254435.1 hypothetical protein [Pseudomonas sp.]